MFLSVERSYVECGILTHQGEVSKYDMNSLLSKIKQKALYSKGHFDIWT